MDTSPPDVLELFAAHIAVGWKFNNEVLPGSSHARAGGASRQPPAFAISPPASNGTVASITLPLGLRAPAGAYGLTSVADSGPFARGPASCAEVPQHATMRGPLRRAVGAVSAARLAAAVLLHAGWCAAALTALDEAVTAFDSASVQGGIPRISLRAAVTLAETLKQCSAEARAALPAAASMVWNMSPSSAVAVTAALDACYHALLEHSWSCSWGAPLVPPPHRWFPGMAAAHPGNAAAFMQLIAERSPRIGKAVFVGTWGLVEGADGTLGLKPETAVANPLLAVMLARLQEGCRLMWASGFGTHGELDDAISAAGQPANKRRRLSESGKRSGGGNPEPWPAYPALRTWRESGREVHQYAYAAPNEEALQLLAARAPLVEIGAGTGYWARCLAERGVEITAYDLNPPAPDSDAANAFHGRLPAFTEVKRGGPKAASGSKHALFLCYPPPGDKMAFNCLRRYRGTCVVVVGEWDGDTAEPQFTAQLQADFRLVQRHALPNWTDTAHELTIWERRRAATLQPEEVAEESAAGAEAMPAGDDPALPSLPLVCCAACGVPHGGPATSGGTAGTGKALRRCRLCREAAYCSAECRRAHAKRHAEMHALRLLFLQRKMSFTDDRDFEDLRL